MPWNYCTNRFASPDLAKNPLLNSAGGCYTAPDGGPTMYLSAYDLANSRRSNTKPSVGSTTGAAMVHRATMGALFNAPMIGPAVSRRSFGTLGDIASDMCSAGTQRDVGIGLAVGGALAQVGGAIAQVGMQNSAPGDNTWADVNRGIGTAGGIASGLAQGYRQLCAATGGQQQAQPDLSRYTPGAMGGNPYRPSAGTAARPPMSTGAKVGIGVGVGLAALAAFSFFR
jgi:hypothetical protein